LRYCAAGFVVQTRKVHAECGGEDVGKTTRKQLVTAGAPIIAGRKGRSSAKKAADRQQSPFGSFVAKKFKIARANQQDRWHTVEGLSIQMYSFQ
jgi:hypothetical protein